MVEMMESWGQFAIIFAKVLTMVTTFTIGMPWYVISLATAEIIVLSIFCSIFAIERYLVKMVEKLASLSDVNFLANITFYAFSHLCVN